MQEEKKLKGVEGLYTAIGAIINQKEDESRLAVDVNNVIENVKNEVNVYSAQLEWYIQFALMAAVEVVLYQKGYRSVVKGEGVFVNLQNCRKPEYLARMFNNAKLSEAQKQKVVARITKAIQEATMEGQLSFDFSGEGGTIVEEVTEQRLIEMLRADADAV